MSLRTIKDIKVCFAASSGGHLEQMLMLGPLMERYDSFILTEKTAYAAKLPVRARYVRQVNRREVGALARMAISYAESLDIWREEHPDVIVRTGALSTIPFCLIGKDRSAKLVYIKSYAKTVSPTMRKAARTLFGDLKSPDHISSPRPCPQTLGGRLERPALRARMEAC